MKCLIILGLLLAAAGVLFELFVRLLYEVHGKQLLLPHVRPSKTPAAAGPRPSCDTCAVAHSTVAPTHAAACAVGSCIARAQTVLPAPIS